ncbi:MAG: hypothetical protein LBV80_02680, partial [Deltaproteobacteria bacterium]|nr:hypothetical protein [Deltaproteobacteria bacterium]
MSNEASNQKKPAGPRVITLRLRLPVLILTLVLFAIGLTWIFMAGVLVGRGYSAREEIGVLASFMPSPQVAEPTGSASPEASDSAEASGIDSLFPADESSRKGAPADNPDGLLRGEDLAFKDSLTAPETPASAQTSQPRPAQPAQTVQPVPQTGAANARQTGTPQTGATDTVVYEYIYQVSSFSQLHQAQ